MVLAVLLVGGRVSYLQVLNRPFLQNEGDKRTVREEVISAHRGMIFDRNGSPLAVSTSVTTLWADPRILVKERARWPELAKALGISPKALSRKIENASGRGFMYLERRMQPADAKKILDLDISGVNGLPEYRRFYPAGEVAAQLVGLTDIDDKGQEGVELALDGWLSGKPGSMRLIKDRRGKVIRETDVLRSAEPGHEIKLSIDLRIQYLAYRELVRAVRENEARTASLVMLDVKTGEVLAMVNQPSFNPNDRSNFSAASVRNRAIVDQFEPGSVIKPFTVAAALESGRYSSHTPVNTSPGWMRVGRDVVKDVRNFGKLDVTGVITKSSNVGVSKLALDIGPERLVSLFQRVGLGQSTGVVFPGESTGLMPSRSSWKPIETATLSYGYGLSVTSLQLAQAYMILANDGRAVPVSLIKRDIPVESQQVVDPQVARRVLDMMRTVTGVKGTGRRARTYSYTVAGKTGTVKKLGVKGYSDDSYISLFAGVIPANKPRVAMVVVLDGTKSTRYYGGVVAAPVFSRVAGEAMRMLGVPADDADSQHMLVDTARNSRNES
ncbi:penicillin-binding transpeptidase domain-containing protein [Sansalvadorimonas sp. 2012CJ34-2]|uniref:Peptidoglycan D,D-transpeptidase FtsI n=1 Tax=Parendozoicomonas callyspongiae TaxID=2942213 RepID=A0ABT0PD67_9GAMM|nr:penicillin-binding transpeptidase domain-containing protein [Sansalvadorimonas sp. 2012CJ34-2]MCL6268976.1 penicillin-binding transpeptidase domain-containing protein [Sansalvadorimonas sp. 2012CJ34-2]